MKDAEDFGSLLTSDANELLPQRVSAKRHAELRALIDNDRKWRSLEKLVGVDLDPDAANLDKRLQHSAKIIRNRQVGKAGGRPRNLTIEAEYWMIKFVEDLQKEKGISCRQACVSALKELSENSASRLILEVWLGEPLKREPGVRRKKQFETLGKRLQNLIVRRNSQSKKLHDRGGLASLFREKPQV
ncbi:MAG: hypothetical protein ACI9JL_002812 [Paracoccaceae bacterium]|jgi:hypothetical protein